MQTQKSICHGSVGVILKKIIGHKYATSLRFALLRLLCIASVSAALVELITGKERIVVQREIHWIVGTTVLSQIILIHHLASAFGPAFGPVFLLPRCIDGILLSLEMTGIVLQVMQNPVAEIFSETHSSKVARTLSWWTLLVVLSGLLIFRLGDFWAALMERSLYQSLIKGYDLLWPIRNGLESGEAENIEDERRGTKIFAARVFFGNWREHFRGEASWVMYSRGLLSTALILGILIHAWFNLVQQPFQENALRLVREHRATTLPPDIILTRPGFLRVIVARSHLENFGQTDLAAAVTLQTVYRVNKVKGRCALNQTREELVIVKNKVIEIETLSFFCHDLSQTVDPEALRVASQADFIVTVNFTQLGLWDDGGFIADSVQIYLGLTKNTLDVVTKSSPIVLTPGANLVGLMRTIMRREFLSPRFSVVGIFDIYRTFLTSETVYVWPNSITRSPADIGTVRIKPPVKSSEWKVVEEYCEKSVLSGISTVGGLWTFLAGIFAAIYGTSVMKILFALKPLSLFGYAHFLQKEKLRQAYMAEYPRVKDDLQVLPHDRGLLALIHDHLLELDFLSTKQEENNPEVTRHNS
ncbi:hypothetical protein CPB83DRAFT_910834 [Crepidotus variabilis]|uniref:Uncharacterized protein n=1 Tax=Crepidotus variabilis TaxID=179855 RepID=A0A9P6E5W2_9AGAR|nr:hypothetical protein CPB83DRAFT_910834 [Crepidotus variabilis]